MAHFHKTHMQKRKQELGSGDDWLHQTLVDLEVACAQHDLKTKEESPEEAAEREGPTVPMMEMASLLFRKLASLSASEGVSRADFIKAKLIKKSQQPRVIEVLCGAVTVPHLQRAANELVAAGAFHAINA